MMVSENVLPIVAGTLVTCTLCQWIAWRIKLPAIIFLLLTGILAGSILGLLEPEKLLGNLFFPFVSISVAVILFEGSLTLRFKDILGLETVVRNTSPFFNGFPLGFMDKPFLKTLIFQQQLLLTLTHMPFHVIHLSL